MAEIMLPTTSRSLSVIKLRDMCLTNRPFEPITKTSSMLGSGADGRSSAGGGGGATTFGGTRFTVASAFFGGGFFTGTMCQMFDDAPAHTRPAPRTKVQPSPGVG